MVSLIKGYPEHDKLLAIKDQTQAIGEFLDWLHDDKGISLTKRDGFGDLVPVATHWEPLLAEWAGIDRDRLECERRRMLEVMRRRFE